MLYEALERLDALMAIGEKRREAKAQAAARGEATFAFSDQRIHSYQSRTTYQDVVMRFLRWCRASFGLNRLTDIDLCAEELTCAYLEERMRQGYSPWTLATERSALRLFFQERTLAESVSLPKRHSSQITRSRLPAQRDGHLQPAHWQPLISFCQACGLRREELRDLRVHDVCVRRSDERLVVRVVHGKGGKWREVPVLDGQEEVVLAQVRHRPPDEHVFAHLPVHLDIQAYRRSYAKCLYEQLAGGPLPPLSSDRRLQASEVDQQAAFQVSAALGHARLDVVLLYYLR
ncbi:tyrosine-type recombinase/integrase [Reticulibacter mediterranei]|nr:site-specific integrase [Reticulibacter mediterranei]